jgi:hypothetical protein
MAVYSDQHDFNPPGSAPPAASRAQAGASFTQPLAAPACCHQLARRLRAKSCRPRITLDQTFNSASVFPFALAVVGGPDLSLIHI